jgi:Sulfotransferase domain
LAILRDFIDWREFGQLAKMLGQLLKCMFGPGGLTESNTKRVFIEYHENLRRIVPKERLLEFQVQDGYRPLCEFLGVPVPTTVVDGKEVEEAFPKVNEGNTFADRLVIKNKLANRRVMKKIGTSVSIVASVGAGLWYLRSW